MYPHQNTNNQAMKLPPEQVSDELEMLKNGTNKMTDLAEYTDTVQYESAIMINHGIS